jgi:hypothetical protein
VPCQRSSGDFYANPARDWVRWRAMGAQWKQKGREQSAANKGRVFTKLAKEIMVASRTGGPDPTSNARLRLAIEQAKRASMTKETLERAIKKGAGLLDDQAAFETVVYEGFAPHQVPVIVECLTDNKNRTAPNTRKRRPSRQVPKRWRRRTKVSTASSRSRRIWTPSRKPSPLAAGT